MRFFGKTAINFMGVRRTWYTVSATIILAGVISLFVKGLDYGIDFLGGTELIASFQNDVKIADVRSAMESIGLGQAEIKYFGSDRDIVIQAAMEGEGTAERIRAGLSERFVDNPFEVLKEDKIGPKVGAELRQNALLAVLASLAAICLYIAFRFKFIYGIGALIALFHDVLVTFGLISIFDGVLNLEINQNMVAAFLTLVGLSVNDTVVIFDRIRENAKVFRGMSLVELINKSINETLSRTIITSGTIFLVLAILFVFGGEVNRGFAFALVIGIITGTYSSIYIASATVVEWSERVKKKSHVTG
jgi:preprotein translocase subunit SecF